MPKKLKVRLELLVLFVTWMIITAFIGAFITALAASIRIHNTFINNAQALWRRIKNLASNRTYN